MTIQLRFVSAFFAVVLMILVFAGVVSAALPSAKTGMLGTFPWFRQTGTPQHPNLGESSCGMYSAKEVLWWWNIRASVDDIWDYLDDIGETPEWGIWHPRELAYVYRHYGLDVRYDTCQWMELDCYNSERIKWNIPVNIWVSTSGLGVFCDHVITVVGYDDDYEWPDGDRGAFYVHDTSGAFVTDANPDYPEPWDVPVPYDKLMDAWDCSVWDAEEFAEDLLLLGYLWEPGLELPQQRGYITAYPPWRTFPRGARPMVEVLAPTGPIVEGFIQPGLRPGEMNSLLVMFSFETEGDLPTNESGVFLRLEGATFVGVDWASFDGTFSSVRAYDEGGNQVDVEGSRILELSDITLYRDIDTMVASGPALVTIGAYVWIRGDDPPPQDGVAHIYYRGWLVHPHRKHHQCPLHTIPVPDDRRPRTVMPRVEPWIERYPDDVIHDGKDRLDYATRRIDIAMLPRLTAGAGEYLYPCAISVSAEPSEIRLGEEVTVSGSITPTTLGGQPIEEVPADATVTLTYNTIVRSVGLEEEVGNSTGTGEGIGGAGGVGGIELEGIELEIEREIPTELKKPPSILNITREIPTITITREVTTDASGFYSDTFVPDKVGHWWVNARYAGYPPFMGTVGSASFDVLPEEASTATIALDKPVYDLTDTARVTLTDHDLNIDPAKLDWVSVTVSSTSDTTGIELRLIETGANTGVFEAEFTLTPLESSDMNLHVMGGDAIAIAHRDLVAGNVIRDTTTVSAIAPPEVPPDQTITRGAILIFESARAPHGSSVQIPITIKNAEEIGNMDLVLIYDPSVLTATDVIKGSLTQGSMFQSNIVDGTIRIAFVDTDGISGDGSIGYITFDVIERISQEELSSPLTIESVRANDIDGEEVSITTINGGLTVGEIKGDCDRDREITAVDALMALEMSVGLLEVDLIADMNEDGEVTSSDAAEILRIGVEIVAEIMKKRADLRVPIGIEGRGLIDPQPTP